MTRLAALLLALLATGCALPPQPAPGHEPPSAGTYDPVSGSFND